MPKSKFNYDKLDQSHFNKMADVLLNEFYLKINGQKYRLVEIEFYVNSKQHPDPYSHRNPDILLMNIFYFHRFPNGSYVGGTRKGLSLGFGSQRKNVFFGVLLRTIENMETGEVIEGPSKIVDHVLAEYNRRSVISFTNNDNLNIFKNSWDFILVPSKRLKYQELYYGPRIGLSDKAPRFRDKKYRYVADINKVKKKNSTLEKLKS